MGETCSLHKVRQRVNCPITGLDMPLGLQEFEGLRISKQSAPESGKVASVTHRPPSPAEDIPGTHLY